MNNKKECWITHVGLYSFLLKYNLVYRTLVFLSVLLLLASYTSADTGLIIDGSPVLRSGQTIIFIATVFSNYTSNVTLNRLEVYNEQGILLENQTINEMLSNSSIAKSFTLNVNQIKSTPQLWDNLRLKITAIMTQNGLQTSINQTYTLEIQPQFTPPNPQTGEQTPTKTTGTYDIGVKSTTLSEPTYATGDQHVHSRYSCGSLVTGYNTFDCPAAPIYYSIPTITSMVNQAKQSGFSWIHFTDHASFITPQNFQSASSDCQNTISSGFTCAYGEELALSSSVCSSGRGLEEYLSLGASSYINGSCFGETDCYDCKCTSAQNGISRTASVNGFGFLAHPFDSGKPWVDWGVSGYSGLEIMNGPWDDSDSQSVQKWIQLLLAESNPNDGFAVGIGNSDAHRLSEVGNSYTMCFLDSFSESNINNALKRGSCMASNDGGFVVFTVRNGSNMSVMGGVLSASGQQVNVTIYHGVYNKCNLKLIKGVRGGSETVLQTWSNIQYDTNSPKSFVDTPNANSYYRVECIGSSNTSIRTYTNPIWVSFAGNPFPQCHNDHCTPIFPCSHGGGDCDTQRDCVNSSCTYDVGDLYGCMYYVDVCVSTTLMTSTSSTTLQTSSSSSSSSVRSSAASSSMSSASSSSSSSRSSTSSSSSRVSSSSSSSSRRSSSVRTSTTTTVPFNDYCILSMCDCKCYGNSSFPHYGLRCGVLCSSSYNVTGCVKQNNACVPVYVSSTAPTTIGTTSSTTSSVRTTTTTVVSTTLASGNPSLPKCHNDKCTPTYPCSSGLGDCDTNKDCVNSQCQFDVGSDYGCSYSTDMCV